MRVEPNPAFILHRRSYRETSLLLDVFSREHGRISLIAKGAKRKKTDTTELLQPYQRLLLAWSGRGELMSMTALEADKPAYILNHNRLIAGFYLNELIVRMLHPHEAHADLFDNYDKAVDSLANTGLNMESIIRIFEKNILNSLGYGLVLDHDVLTREKIEPDSIYDYRVDRGPSRITQEFSGQIRVTGHTLLALESERFGSEKTLKEAKILMRFILRSHLGDKPLLSRSLYKSYVDNSRIIIS